MRDDRVELKYSLSKFPNIPSRYPAGDGVQKKKIEKYIVSKILKLEVQSIFIVGNKNKF